MYEKIELMGIGNALIDELFEIDEAVLQATALPKNSMNLVTLEEAHAISKHLKSSQKSPYQIMAGGSAGNTMAIYAQLGGKGAFLGKLGDDERGDNFANTLQNDGIILNPNARSKTSATGFCQVMITPDSERTMVTCLGAANELTPADISPDLIKHANITYMEGYLYDRDEAKQCFIEAARLTHQAGHKVSLTLSDSFCVERHFDDFHNLIHGHIDILFANEDEIKAFYPDLTWDEIIAKLQKSRMLTILTLGPKGALIIDGGKDNLTKVPTYPLKEIKDRTGAGDAFAAGFLYGYNQGWEHEKSGSLAVHVASTTIMQIGGRPLKNSTRACLEKL